MLLFSIAFEKKHLEAYPFWEKKQREMSCQQPKNTLVWWSCSLKIEAGTNLLSSVNTSAIHATSASQPLICSYIYQRRGIIWYYDLWISMMSLPLIIYNSRLSLILGSFFGTSKSTPGPGLLQLLGEHFTTGDHPGDRNFALHGVWDAYDHRWLDLSCWKPWLGTAQLRHVDMFFKMFSFLTAPLDPLFAALY